MLFTVHDLYHFLCLKRIRKYEVERTGNTDTTTVEFRAAREAYAMLYSKPSIALGSWPEDCNVFVCGVRATSRAISTLKTGTLLAMLKTGTFTGGAEDRHFYRWCWRPALLLVVQNSERPWPLFKYVHFIISTGIFPHRKFGCFYQENPATPKWDYRPLGYIYYESGLKHTTVC